MLVGVADAFVFSLVTLVCLATGILTTKEPRNFEKATSVQSPSLAYLPTASAAFPKLSPHDVFGNQALNNGLEDVEPSGRHFTERQRQVGYSYLKPLSIDFKLPSKDQPIRTIADKQRSAKTAQSTSATATTIRSVQVFQPDAESRQPGEIERQRVVPQRSSSYQVVEEDDEYGTNDSDHAGLAYRGKARTTNPHRNSQDVTMAIKALDHFLSGVLNDDSYNSGLHPPPNPVLALVLSRYGRYVPGARNSRLYAHTAINNMHNNKPFGSYKLEKEQTTGYDRK